MVAAAVLGAGWAWQALAAWLRIPAPAPRNAAASSTSTAAMATVTWMLPESGRGRAIGVSCGVAAGGGLGVPDRLAAAGLDHGDREIISHFAAPGGAGDGLADLHRDDHRAGVRSRVWSPVTVHSLGHTESASFGCPRKRPVPRRQDRAPFMKLQS